MEAVFSVRGLCNEAVMDTQYKLASHAPGTMLDNIDEIASARNYVGPKGWIISRNETDKKWRMGHYHYTHLTLTMLDMDMLPMGRHKWMMENNVCNEGQTSSQVLQISGCNEQQFTCDDGKCINISQRCKGRLQKKKSHKLGLLAQPPLTPTYLRNLGPLNR